MDDTESRHGKQVATAIYQKSLTINEFRLLQLLPGLDDVSSVAAL